MTERAVIFIVEVGAVTIEHAANLIDAGKPSNSTKSVTVK